MGKEHCCKCDIETGRAGRGDDSLFIQLKDGEIGPLCESCHDKYAKYEVDKPYCTQEQADAAYAATCKMAAAGELYDAATGALDALVYVKRTAAENVPYLDTVVDISDHMDGPGTASIAQLRAAIKKAKGH